MASITTYSQRERMNSETIIVFDHIPKCAGTSFDAWLTDVYAGRKIHLHCHADYLDLLSKNEFDFKIISDHYTWGVHHFLPDHLDVAYITLIRDPLQTAISLYKFSKNQLFGDYDKDINSYLLEYQSNMFTNHLGQGSLQKAKEKLFETYIAFGVIESYNESIAHIADILKIEGGIPAQTKRNVSKSTNLKINDAVVDVFKKINADDYELYNAALNELTRRKSRVKSQRAEYSAAKKPDAVLFTENLPDVTTHLDNKEYDKALSLLRDNYLDSLPRNMILFACSLAQKIGDLEQAEHLHSRLQDKFKHTYADYHAEFLMTIGKYAQAMELAEAELAVFDSFQKIECDSKLFEQYVHYICILIKACHYTNSERIDFFIKKLTSLCAESEFSLNSLLHTLCEIGLYARAIDTYYSFKAIKRYNPAALYKIIAHAYYTIGNFENAKQICQDILALYPTDAFAIKTLIVMDRKFSAFKIHLDAYQKLASRFPGTLYSATILKEIAISHYENKQPQKAFAILESLPLLSADTLIESSCGSHRVSPFNETRLRDFLVIKSGPHLVFDYLYSNFLIRNQQQFDIVRAGGGDASSEFRLISKDIAFPSSRYMHQSDFPAISANLNKKYADCIVIMSDLNFPAYNEILKLASSVTTNTVYLYSLSHLLSSRFKQSLLAATPHNRTGA